MDYKDNDHKNQDELENTNISDSANGELLDLSDEIEYVKPKANKKFVASMWIVFSAVTMLLIAVCFFMFNRQNPAKAAEKDEDNQVEEVGVVDESIGNEESTEESSSEESGEESTVPEVEVSIPNDDSTKVTPSTGNVTTAPEYKYDATQDTKPSDNREENADKNPDDGGDKIVELPNTPGDSGGSSEGNTSEGGSSSEGGNSSPDSSTGDSSSTKYVVFTTNTYVNVRAGAGTNNAQIGQMETGKEYEYVGQDSDSNGTLWYHINFNGKDGWVSSEFSTKKEHQAENPSQPSQPDNSKPDTNTEPTYKVGWNTVDGKQYYYNGTELVKGWADIGGFRYRFDDNTGENRSEVGIDVSTWQGNIDWFKVKQSGVQYAFIRVGFRGYDSGSLALDNRFLTNIQKAKAAGVKVGVYFYSTAISTAEGAQEANFVLDAVKGYSLDLPIVIDVEHAGDRCGNLSKEARTDATLAFLQTVKNAGHKSMYYTGYYFLQDRLLFDRLSGYPLWLAFYTNNPDKPSKYPYTYWQYSDKGSVGGINGTVDLNVMVK